MAVEHRIYTYDDLAATPDDGKRYEILGGELIVSPSPITVHQRITTRLNVALANFVWERGLGEVMVGPTDVRISDDNVVVPDILFISQERLAIIHEKYVADAPDLVIEVLSPGTRRIDLGRKKALYASAGVREYWIADPNDQSVKVFSLVDGAYEEIEQSDDTVRSRIVPGFEIGLEDIFANP